MSKPARKHWTGADEAWLRANYPSLGEERSARHLGRSVPAIRHKVNRLGLRRQEYRPWLTTELAHLRQHYAAHGARAVAAQLGRTEGAVRNRAAIEGLRRDSVVGTYTLDAIRRRCSIDPDDHCWNWRGFLSTHGAPGLWHMGHRRPVRALVLELLGKPLRDGHISVPRCGNPLCVNPDHVGQRSRRTALATAGARANTAERIAHITRTRRAQGKLSEAKAAYIRASAAPAKDLAQELGVNLSMIYRVRAGTSWNPMPLALSLAAGV